MTEAFKQWLVDQGYQPSTAASTERMVLKAEEQWRAGNDIGKYEKYLKRLSTYLHNNGAAGTFDRFVRSEFSPVEVRPVGSQKPEPISEEQWKLMVELMMEPSRENLVLRVLLGVPYPARELQVTLTDPIADLKRELPKPYAKLLKMVDAPNLQEYLSPGNTYEAAYLRLNRQLASIGQQLGRKLTIRDIEATDWKLRFVALEET